MCQFDLTRARDATAVSEEMFVYSRRGQNGAWHRKKYSIGIARHFNVYYESIILLMIMIILVQFLSTVVLMLHYFSMTC